MSIHNICFHSAASDLGLHCLLRSVCPNTEGYFYYGI